MSHFNSPAKQKIFLSKKEPLIISPKGILKTLKVIKDNGEGTEIEFGYQIKKFKCKNGCEHHNHLVCVACGHYFYIDSEELEEFQDKIARNNGFIPKKHNFKIMGICESCRL